MRDAISTISCVVYLSISSGNVLNERTRAWKRGDGLYLSPMCNLNCTDACVIITPQHNNYLQVYLGHYLSRTGSIWFWPIAWLVGCFYDLIPGCTRFLLQPDRVCPFVVVAL